jgi:hypothetical protein
MKYNTRFYNLNGDLIESIKSNNLTCIAKAIRKDAAINSIEINDNRSSVADLGKFNSYTLELLAKGEK